MKLNELATQIAYSEGNKTQVTIGNIREVLAILSDMLASAEGHKIATALTNNGVRRAKKKYAGKKKSSKREKKH